MKKKEQEIEIMNCEKCRRTETLHGTPCKKHKKPDNDPNRANDMRDANGDMIDIKLNN